MKIIFAFCLLCLVISGCGKEVSVEDNINNHFQFTYKMNLDSLPADTENLEIIIPLAKNSDFQEVFKRDIYTDLPYEIIEDSLYHNQFIYVNTDSQFTSYEIKVVYDIAREENNAIKNEMSDIKLKIPVRYLSPDSLVPIDGKVADEAIENTEADMTPFNMAKALYYHLYNTMSYDKSGEGWGRGDAIYACDIRKGNCTDFHSLFIGMCRSQNIPARFKMGFNIPSDTDEAVIGGYHCWAEFYPGGANWIPVDISEAWKDSTKKDYLFGNLDDDRVEFTLGRDIPVNTVNGVKNLNYSIYPTVFINGDNYSGYLKEFSFKRL